MALEPHELMEEMEHASHADHVAAHGGGHDKGAGAGTGKLIGLTMAVLGVLLAFSSAMVGASRTEFIAAMVQKSTAALEYQGLSTKYRMIEGHVQAMHAALPTDLKAFMAQDAEITATAAAIGGDGAQQAKLLVLVRDQIMNTVMPTEDDAKRLVALTRQFDRQQEKAREWVESHDELIETHYQASERYERGQLCSEVGIVLASIALLLMNRRVWAGAVLLAVVCVGLNAYAFVSTHAPAHDNEEKIETAKKGFEATIDEKAEKAADDKLLEEIEGAYPPSDEKTHEKAGEKPTPRPESSSAKPETSAGKPMESTPAPTTKPAPMPTPAVTPSPAPTGKAHDPGY